MRLAHHHPADRCDPRQSVDGGARYLRHVRERLDASIPEPDRTWMALAAYNAGPKAVEKYKGIPPYKETRNYVKIIYGQ